MDWESIAMAGVLAFFYFIQWLFISSGLSGNLWCIYSVELGCRATYVVHPYFGVVHRYMALLR